MSHETSAEPPDWVMLNDHPQLRFLPDDSWIGSPEFDRRHPNCQPSTVLASDLTWLLVPVQFKLVSQPIRSPSWQVDQMVLLPLPLLAPHQLLFTQYLPRVM